MRKSYDVSANARAREEINFDKNVFKTNFAFNNDPWGNFDQSNGS
jgi:hypothetical protein